MFLVRTLVAAVICLALLGPARVTAEQAAPSPGPRTRNSQVAWTLIGGGIGLGVGLASGLLLFDDAVHSERKVWTTAVIGSIGGGIVGRLASRAKADASADAGSSDSLWNGMAFGAATGAVVGLWYVPAHNCKPEVNPECPGRLRLGVGIPAIAGGAALGALIDRLVVERRPAHPDSSVSGRRTIVMPVLAPGLIGVHFSTSFK